jgi:hypothetical protein
MGNSGLYEFGTDPENLGSIRNPKMRRLLSICAVTVAVCLARPASADGVPQVTRDFLPYCKAHLDDCYEEIATIVISNAAVSQKKFCFPKSALVSTETYTASHRRVIKWMTDHPESHGQPTDTGIRAGLIALYPCR